MWVISARCLDHVGLVVRWTCILPFGEVGVGFWVPRVVLCASVPGHQSGLCLDLDLDLHSLVSY